MSKIDRGGVRMKVEVLVDDSRSAGDLIRMLLEQFDGEGVSFDAERRRVCFEHRDRDGALVRLLDVVEEWVNVYKGAPTQVEIEGRSYLLAPSVPIPHPGTHDEGDTAAERLSIESSA
jgi:hypothetical protein